MDKFFQIKEKGSTVRRELLAGLTTFLTMSYIIFVNPAILGKTGMDPSGVLVASCLAAALGTLIMGLYAKFPFAQAPGMGLNAFFVFTVVFSLGYSWQQALGIVFLSGILFVIMTITGLRMMVIKAIPTNLKLAIAPGIGLFIALIGLNNAGIIDMNQGPIIDVIIGNEVLEKDTLIEQVQAAPPQIIELGNLSKPSVYLAIFGFFFLSVLMVLKVKAAMIYSILGITVIGIPLGVTQLPGSYSLEEISLAGTAFELEIASLFTVPEGKSLIEVIVTVSLVVISFTLVDLFDTLGTLIGTAAKGNMLDKEGNLEGMEKALAADAVATVSGALLGTSTVTTYIESSAGIVAGGRTGLTAVSTGILFILSVFLAPFAGMIPAAATAPVLIMVGILMLEGVKKLELENVEQSIPAAVLIMLMPFTYSIANGIAIGIMAHVLIQVVKGNIKNTHPVLFILVILFVLRYLFV